MLLLLLILYITVHHVRLRRAILTHEWRVNFHDIHITEWLQSPSLECSTVGSAAVSKRSSYNTTAITTTTTSLEPVVLLDAISYDVDREDTADYSHHQPHQDFSPTVLSAIIANGKWSNRDVSIRRIPHSVLISNKLLRRTKITLLQLKSKVIHPNVLKFFGLTYPSPPGGTTTAGLGCEYRALIVSELATKGCLNHVLNNEHYQLDDNFKFAMAIDVANGMTYLHGLDLIHGSLRYCSI